MIFGAGRQISSLQEKYENWKPKETCSLIRLSKPMRNSLNLRKNSLLHRQILELERACSEQNKRCLELQDDLDKEK